MLTKVQKQKINRLFTVCDADHNGLLEVSDFDRVSRSLAAIRGLGEHFRTRLEGAPDQPLITTGFYAWIRHPSELGNGCIVLGLATLADAGAFVALVAAAALLLVNARVRAEDAALVELSPVVVVKVDESVALAEPVVGSTVVGEVVVGVPVVSPPVEVPVVLPAVVDAPSVATDPSSEQAPRLQASNKDRETLQT